MNRAQPLARPAVALSVLVIVAVPLIGATGTASVHGLIQRLLVLLAGAYGIWVAQRAYVLAGRVATR